MAFVSIFWRKNAKIVFLSSFYAIIVVIRYRMVVHPND